MTPAQKLIFDSWEGIQSADFHALQAYSTLTTKDTSEDPRLNRENDTDKTTNFDSQIDPLEDLNAAIKKLKASLTKLTEAKTLITTK